MMFEQIEVDSLGLDSNERKIPSELSYLTKDFLWKLRHCSDKFVYDVEFVIIGNNVKWQNRWTYIDQVLIRIDIMSNFLNKYYIHVYSCIAEKKINYIGRVKLSRYWWICIDTCLDILFKFPIYNFITKFVHRVAFRWIITHTDQVIVWKLILLISVI